MTAPFLRCLAVDPYYFSTMDTVLLPSSYRDRLPPGLGEAYHQALAALQAGDYLRALAMLQGVETAAEGADDGLGSATAAVIHAMSGNRTEAETTLNRAVAVAPHCAEYRHLAGVLALRRRDIAAAVGHFHDAVRLDPALGPAWAALALVFTLDGQWAAVEWPARRALALGCECGAHLVTYGLLFATLLQGRPPAGPFLVPPAGPLPDGAAERVLARLPAVTGWRPPAEPEPESEPEPVLLEPVLFVACDGVYLIEHALALLWSLEETAKTGTASFSLHLHIFNPGPDDLSRLAAVVAGLKRVRVSHSLETVDVHRFGSAAVYYSCARFCRFYHFVRTIGRAAVMLDADCLFRKSPDHLPGWGRGDLDLALFENPAAPPWERFLAWGVYAAATPPSLAFLAWVAVFVGQNLIARKGLWFMDQIALFLAHWNHPLSLRVQSWTTDSFDLNHGDLSVVWTITRNKDQASRYNQYKQYLIDFYHRPGPQLRSDVVLFPGSRYDTGMQNAQPSHDQNSSE